MWRPLAVSPVLQPVKRELDTLAQRLNSTTDFHSAAVDAASAMFHHFEVVQHAPARPRLTRKPMDAPGQSPRSESNVLQCVERCSMRPSRH